MATITTRKPCAKCSKGSGVTTCDGCQQSFCTKHFVEHRHELSQQMNNISQEHGLFRRDLSKESPKHPYLNRIDSWERESISKIQAAAEIARTDLRQLLDRTKNDLKTSVEKLTNEINSCQQSDDFTENDLKRWSEQLKELRKNLDTPSTIFLVNDDDMKSSIHLIRICDKQLKQQQQIQRPCTPVIRTLEHRMHNIKDSTCIINEKFGDIDGKATLSEDNLLVTCCLVSILTQPIIYGINRYSTGKHQIRFRIEKMGDLRLFFGIIRSLENISRSGQAQNNNNSLYGWWDLNEAIINGKVQTTKYRNIVSTGDELTLILDCDNKQVQLQHHRTKRLAQLLIDLNKCPFPWKIVIRLQSAGDCVRILQ
ncbi:unnamed protein product [Rotaria sp. Silwood2]|nr:unnamed protein product [Rotaria sp. Silwood2]CAF3068543.1 unnamed protein product [Rotaria sp. Silwood2]CAF4081928.1 unnamed protein product [Rotaria sp. Silwood2]CAF4176974.1 unnamed protein product [Rotaria sp. Silwood2]CAF4227984.1 unnamed protein product [Rotaria sp. Silwood2]